MNARRGYVPEDDRNFSPDSLKSLQKASRHILYLINEGYDLKQASTFVGNHYLLSERQRLAIVRSVATKDQLTERCKKQMETRALFGKTVWIDGFNTIITLEVLHSHSVLFDCMDGTIRDLAALRGTYRIIPETAKAIHSLFSILRDAKIQEAKILLDQPVSNSGRLKILISEIGEEYDFELDIKILKAVDRTLYGKKNVITTDSVILDHCLSWYNLVGECVKRSDTKPIRVWSEENCNGNHRKQYTF